jgi:O-antigen biosynthesis protein
MVEEAEARGHPCTLFLYDINSDDVARHEQVIRRYWPHIRAEIRSATGRIEGIHALVASSWGTAHVVAKRAPSTVNCFYFIQDYEPYFYPRGALYALAEDTYRFGFTNIALGEMVASRLLQELGIVADATVPFGCDTSDYKLLPREAATTPRTGIVYYAKRTVDRRGYLLAKLALEDFHRRHPEQEIHIFGDTVAGWPFPVTNHGSLHPAELNVLYNQTIASLALSFTNISLVAEELMAAGNVPVMNDHPFSRADLSAPHAIWAPATPSSIADGLSSAVTATDIDGRAQLLAETVRKDWRKPSTLVCQEIERVCSPPSAHHGLCDATGMGS